MHAAGTDASLQAQFAASNAFGTVIYFSSVLRSISGPTAELLCARGRECVPKARLGFRNFLFKYGRTWIHFGSEKVATRAWSHGLASGYFEART